MTSDPAIEVADVEAVHSGARQAPILPPLYAGRIKVHPRRVYGTFRNLKWSVMIVCLAIYYLSPWLRWDRGPGAPDQAILIDFPGRRFYFFFIEIWPQEVYYITGLLIISALALFLFTSLFGRVWCGYACPQTVWTDLFVSVERWIEGDRNARIKLDQSAWDFDKIRKRVFKHAVWIAISLATGGAWIFYYADAPTLAAELVRLEAPMPAYLFMGLFTLTTYGLGGIAREQVCIYMCPWPRIQSAMFDEESMLVSYRSWRGEPRGKRRRGQDPAVGGHCVDCKQCVVVCPMGIDIREGLQLECIHCALCIDACNSVMGKLDLPRGLIGYDTPRSFEQRRQGTMVRLLRPRVIIYAALIVIVSGIMLAGLLTRGSMDLNVLHDRNPVFVALSDGGLRNGYQLKIINKSRQARSFEITAAGIEGAVMSAVGIDVADPQRLVVQVDPDTLRSVKIYVTAPRGSLSGTEAHISFRLRDPASGETSTVEDVFKGPAR